ncbi:MAG TPA: hypothetical protein VK006_04260, partial [Marinobacter sp.]|nr:hypothetical protein [Marinobacter sp.]
LELSGFAFELPDPAHTRRPWQVGDSVRFGSSQNEKQGKVIRVNRKTCTVAVIHQARHLRYRVPLSLLTHLD